MKIIKITSSVLILAICISSYIRNVSLSVSSQSLLMENVEALSNPAENDNKNMDMTMTKREVAGRYLLSTAFGTMPKLTKHTVKLKAQASPTWKFLREIVINGDVEFEYVQEETVTAYKDGYRLGCYYTGYEDDYCPTERKDSRPIYPGECYPAPATYSEEKFVRG